jgi:hypothetical protein
MRMFNFSNNTYCSMKQHHLFISTLEWDVRVSRASTMSATLPRELYALRVVSI